MAITCEIYLNSAWRSVEIVQPVIVNEAIHNNLKTADCSCRFNIIPNQTIKNYLLGLGNQDADVRIKDGSTVLFQGLLRKNFVIKKYAQRQELYSLEAVGYSIKLDKKLNEDKQYSNKTISYIVEDLLTSLGINYSLPAITTVINAAFKRGESYRVIKTLLKEYGYIFYVDREGIAKAIEISPTSISTVAELNDSNTLDSVELSKKEQDRERIEIEYKAQKTASSGIVFSDTTNAQGVYKCYIQLAAGAYLGGQQYIYADLKYNGNKIISIASHSLDISKDSGIQVLENTLEGNRVKLSIKNNGTTTQNIYKLDILASDIVYEDSAGKEIATSNSNTEKIETIQAKYIYTSNKAQELAQKLLNYYKYSDFIYIVTSKTNITIGAQVLLSYENIGDISARIIEKTIDYQTNKIRYKLEGITEFTAQTQVSEPVYSAPDPLNNQAIIFNYPEQPSNNVTDITADYSENADGTANVTVQFSYAQGVKPATQFLCYVLRSFSTPGSIDYYNDYAIAKPYISDGDYTIQFSVPTRAGSAPIHYKIGVVAANGSKLHTDGAVIPDGWSDKVLTGAIQYNNNNYWDLDSGEMRIGSDSSYIKINPSDGVEIANFNVELMRSALSVSGNIRTEIGSNGLIQYAEDVIAKLPFELKSVSIASFTEYNKEDNCIYYPFGFYKNYFYCSRWNIPTGALDVVKIDSLGNVTSLYAITESILNLFIYNGFIYYKDGYYDVYKKSIATLAVTFEKTLPDIVIIASVGYTVYKKQVGSTHYVMLYNYTTNSTEQIDTTTSDYSFYTISNISNANTFTYLKRNSNYNYDLYKYDINNKTKTLLYSNIYLVSPEQPSFWLQERYFIFTSGYTTYKLHIIDVVAQTERAYTHSTRILTFNNNLTTTLFEPKSDAIYVSDINSNIYLVNNVESGTISLTNVTNTGYIGFTSGTKTIVTRYSSSAGKFAIGTLPSVYGLIGGGAGIIEEGTNSNGSYIKFSNGLMICTGVSAQKSGTFNNYINYGYGHVHSAYDFICNYAAAFVASPYVVTRVKCAQGGGYWTGQYGDSYDTTTSSTWHVWSFAPGSYTNISVQYIAIGRWK